MVIDVVFMDMMMPMMDGQTTILTLQRIKPQVRIVAMSGLMVDVAIAKAKNLGIETFLPKPFTAKILLSTLQKIINSA